MLHTERLQTLGYCEKQSNSAFLPFDYIIPPFDYNELPADKENMYM
jgi:hypothetical protein